MDQWVFCICNPTPDTEKPWVEHHASHCLAAYAHSGQLIFQNKEDWHRYFGSKVLPPAHIMTAWAKRRHLSRESVVFQFALSQRLGDYFASWRYDWDKFIYYWRGHYSTGVDRQQPFPLLSALYRVLAEKWRRTCGR